jgi:hypothetical protein
MSAVQKRPRRATISNPAAARVLFDNRQRNIFAPFLVGPRTISSVAEETGTLLGTVAAMVKRLLALGVVESVDTVRQSGKQVTRYATVADELFVPLDVSEEFLMLPEAQWHKIYLEALRHTALEHHYNVEPIGMVMSLSPQGRVSLDIDISNSPWEPPKNGPFVYFNRSALRLTREDAESLIRELIELEARYETKPVGDVDYYIGAQMVAVPPTHKANPVNVRSPLDASR